MKKYFYEGVTSIGAGLASIGEGLVSIFGLKPQPTHIRLKVPNYLYGQTISLDEACRKVQEDYDRVYENWNAVAKDWQDERKKFESRKM